MSARADSRRWPLPTAEQSGMTLIETMLALSISVMLLLPMFAWAQLAVEQQATTAERNASGASLGLLRSYFLTDVATAHRALATPDRITDCEGGAGDGGEPLFELIRSGRRTVYSVAPNADGEDSLWRRVCSRSKSSDVQVVELVSDVRAKGTSADCTGSRAKVSKDDSANRLSSGQRINGPTASAQLCSRVNLRVATWEEGQTSMSANVRANPSVLDEEADEFAPQVSLVAEPTTGPAVLEVQFSAKGSSDPRGGELKFAWDFGDGATSDVQDPRHTYAKPGEYIAVLTVTNEIGVSSSESVLITATNREPVAVIAEPRPGTRTFRGAPIAFSSLGSNDDADAAREGSIVGYAWDFGDGTTSTEPNPTKTYLALSPIGGFTVTLTVTDSDGGTATASVQVLVENRVPTATIVASTSSGPAPLTVDFSALVVDETTMTPNPALTYSWNFGNGSTSALADPPTTTYAAAGTYTATLTVTDDAGATATATQVVTATASGGISAPSGLEMRSSGVEQGKRYAEFAWNRVENANRYEVAMQCVSCDETASATESGTTVRIRGLSAARNTYYVQVRARDASTGLWGPWSASIEVRP